MSALAQAQAELERNRLAYFEAPTAEGKKAVSEATKRLADAQLEQDRADHLARVEADAKAVADLDRKQAELATIHQGIAKREATIDVHLSAMIDLEREACAHVAAVISLADENVEQFAAARRLASTMGVVTLMQRPPRSESACRHEVGRLIGSAHLTEVRTKHGDLGAVWLQPDRLAATPPRRVVRGPNPPPEPAPPEPEDTEPSYSDELCGDTWAS